MECSSSINTALYSKEKRYINIYYYMNIYNSYGNLCSETVPRLQIISITTIVHNPKKYFFQDFLVILKRMLQNY